MLVDLYFFITEFNLVYFFFTRILVYLYFFKQSFLYLFFNRCYSRLICMFVKQVNVLTRKK